MLNHMLFVWKILKGGKCIKKLLAVLLGLLLWILVIDSAAAISFPTIGKTTNYDSDAFFSPDNRTIVTTSGSNVQISSADTGSIILTIPTNLRNVKATFNTNGTKILVAGHNSNGTVTGDEYDVKTGQYSKKLFTYTPTSRNWSSVTKFLLNNTQTISYVLTNYEITILNNLDGSVIEKITYTDPPRGVLYNHATNDIIVVFDTQLSILNGNTGQFKNAVTLPFEKYSNPIATFDQEGELLYVLAGGKPVVAYDANNNYQNKPFLKNEFSASISNSPYAISVSPNNEYLIISRDSDYKTSIYNRDSGKKLESINTYSRQVAFSPDNRRLLIGTTLYDSSELVPKEFVQLQVEHPTSIVAGQISTFNVYGLTTTNERASIDAGDVQWTIGNTAIVAPYLGKFSGERVGTTSITASYKGLTTTFSISVVPPFKDIAATHPQYEAIYYMREIGIINGYEDDTYRPETLIPRHHVAAMIGRSSIELPAIRAAKSFIDIPTTHANYAHIQKLYRAAIIDGDGNYFKPLNNITHIQLAKILTNIFNLEKANSSTYRFSDISSTSWAQEYAEIVVSNGIMPVTNRQFKPNTPVTRGQFAQYFYNALKLAK